MSCAEKWLKFLLRLNGILAIMAVVAVVMPHAWLEWCVSKVEPGLHAGFIVAYLARSLSMFFVLVGVFMVIFASDVARYRVPITCVAIWVFLAILCFGSYSYAHLPELAKLWFFWFVVADACWSLLFAAAILLCQRRLRHEAAAGARP